MRALKIIIISLTAVVLIALTMMMVMIFQLVGLLSIVVLTSGWLLTMAIVAILSYFLLFKARVDQARREKREGKYDEK